MPGYTGRHAHEPWKTAYSIRCLASPLMGKRPGISACKIVRANSAGDEKPGWQTRRVYHPQSGQAEDQAGRMGDHRRCQRHRQDKSAACTDETHSICGWSILPGEKDQEAKGYCRRCISGFPEPGTAV